MQAIIKNIKDPNFVNSLLLPGGGDRSNYSPTQNFHGHKLLWLQNANGAYFPNLWLQVDEKIGIRGCVLYCHGNGGSLNDFYHMMNLYHQRFNLSIFGVEYPGYGPAEGVPSEVSVNDNVYTAYNYLISIGFPPNSIILIGYSIGSGPVIQLASELCANSNAESGQERNLHPGAVVTIAAFTSIKDLVYDLKSMPLYLNSIAPLFLVERWNSLENIARITCPTMLVHGEVDSLIPCKHSYTLYKACEAGEKVLHTLPKVDHCSFREPEDSVNPIAAFLRAMFKSQKVYQVTIDENVFVVPKSVIEKHSERVNSAIAIMNERQASMKKPIPVPAKIDQTRTPTPTQILPISKEGIMSGKSSSPRRIYDRKEPAKCFKYGIPAILNWLHDATSGSVAAASQPAASTPCPPLQSSRRSETRNLGSISSRSNSQDKSNSIPADSFTRSIEARYAVVSGASH